MSTDSHSDAQTVAPPDDIRPDDIRSGGCLCGAVRYEAKAPLRAVVACHCLQCRKTSGHFAAMTSVPLERFALTRDDGLAWFRSSEKAERGFCRLCGSNLFWKPAGEGRISITAGTLDGPTGLCIERHIYCDYAGDYYAIAEAVPQLPEH